MKRTILIYLLAIVWFTLAVLPLVAAFLAGARIPTGNIIVFHIIGLIVVISSFLLGRKTSNVTLWISRVPIFVEGVVVALVAIAFSIGFLFSFAPVSPVTEPLARVPQAGNEITLDATEHQSSNANRGTSSSESDVR